jgi:hypothetical protein
MRKTTVLHRLRVPSSRRRIQNPADVLMKRSLARRSRREKNPMTLHSAADAHQAQPARKKACGLA